MVCPDAVIPLVAEPIHRGRNDRECHRATFAAQKQESPDAKVSCPSGCCRIIKAYLYCQSSIILLSSWKISNFKLCQSRKMQWIHKIEGMTYTLNRYIDVPRFLTNLSHEKMNIVKLFMWLNEFSSVRHINIARACLEEYMPCLREVYR